MALFFGHRIVKCLSCSHDALQQMKKNLQISEDEKQTLVAELRTSLKSAEHRVEEYGSKVEALEKELLSAQEYINQQRETYADSQQLSLDLEREKGRLAGDNWTFLVIVEVVDILVS